MSDARQQLGSRGEAAAVDYLVKHGFRVLARNFRTRYGELDIIARDGETLVFVEVRTKTHTRHGDPLETITKSKQGKVIKMARWYLFSQGSPDDTICRFDVLGIVWEHGAEPMITHIENAFGT